MTNVRDTSFTVSWITDIPSDGHVNYGADPASLDQAAYDDRGAVTSDDTHHVTLLSLIPNTTYYFDVVSGPTADDNGGDHYAVTTGPLVDPPPASDTVYGQVFKEEEETTPSEGAIVYITPLDHDGSGSPDEAAPLSALVDDTGYWNTNLGNVRTADLNAYFTYSASGDRVKLEAQGAADGAGCLLVDTADDSPAADLILNVSTCLIEAEIPLQLGWNHISLPLAPLTPYTAEGVCDEIISQAGDVTEIDRWYAGGWDGHICGLPFNDFPIELGSDYFIKSSAVSIWTIEGYPVTTPVSLDLQVGWNSIGVPHTDAYTAESLCGEINDQCGAGTAVEVDRWYASGWDGHICGLPFNDFAIEIGKGYFVKASGECTVAPSLAAASSAAVSPLAMPKSADRFISRTVDTGDLGPAAPLTLVRQRRPYLPLVVKE
ncbi:MAG: fibronectin type III domain-containing protein [Chloroflexi bacterium]|nr:fibronectin type III domain-containing protein [Chloroflexota bacterium]